MKKRLLGVVLAVVMVVCLVGCGTTYQEATGQTNTKKEESIGGGRKENEDMFLKFWIISTVICLILYFSTVLSILREMKKEFTKEELKAYKKDDSSYAWYVNVFLLVCPILNIIMLLIIGFNYGEIKEKQFRKIRKANGK